MNIDFVNLQLQYQKDKTDINTNIQAVLNKSNYIMGDEAQQLERSLEDFTDPRYSICPSSGDYRIERLKSLEIIIAVYLSARDGKTTSLPLEY